jgi:DNA-binding NarL/FixJ family response regulator
MGIRVVLADDQQMVRAGFSMILDAETDIEVVGEAEDGAQAVSEARLKHPDVLVMDIQMPNMDGVAATRAILGSPGPAPRVLVVTTFDIDEYVYEALRAGASGFLLKNSSPEDLLRAVRTVAAGEAMLSPSVTRRLLEDFGQRPPGAAVPPAGFDELTSRERDVLLQIARGLSNVEIAGNLFVSPGTVKTHVARVLMKLGLRDRAQAIVLAYESGLVRPGAAD